MSDRADELAATHVRVIATEEAWGIDFWGTWFPCEGDAQEDVVSLAGDIRRGLTRTLRTYAEEARKEEREAWAVEVATWGCNMGSATVNGERVHQNHDQTEDFCAHNIAAAIRARGEGMR